MALGWAASRRWVTAEDGGGGGGGWNAGCWVLLGRCSLWPAVVKALLERPGGAQALSRPHSGQVGPLSVAAGDLYIISQRPLLVHLRIPREHAIVAAGNARYIRLPSHG